MSLAITDQSNTIKFEWTNGEQLHLDKSNMSFKIRGRWVYISENNEFVNINQAVKIRYTEVTSPVVTSNLNLVETLQSYKATGGDVLGKVVITDGVNDMMLEPNGSAPVTIQDQTTPLIMTAFSILEQSTTTTVSQAIGDYTITVASPTGISAGKMITIFNPTSVRFSQFSCISILGSVVTLDSPIDFAYPSGSYVDISEINLAENGSVTPIIAGVRNNAGAIPPPGIELAMDVTRISMICLSATAPTLADFGDISGGLTNGLTLRRRDGEYHNIGNGKTNADFATMMYSFDLYQASTGWGQDGFRSSITFGGQDNFGSVMRLAINEDAEIIIQDDLTSLTSLVILAQGSVVQP